MGTFHVSVEVGDARSERFEIVEALVDTGATYLKVPRPLLDSLGVTPIEKRPFTIADGTTAEYEVGVVYLRIDGTALPVLCVFGEPGAESLLGAVALETFGLAADPVRRQLVRVPGLLM